MESNKLRYFSEKEFNALTPSCSLSDMDSSFLHALDAARHISGVPFVLNCAYRSESWDKEKGRSGSSFHCKGQAVDIRCGDSKARALIVFSLWLCGIRGIGIYSTFIHADFRKEPICFLGNE